MKNSEEAFMALVRAGLWEKEVCSMPSEILDFKEVYHLARKHMVTGLVLAGLEHVVDVRISKDFTLMLISGAVKLEQRNASMLSFICESVEKMHKAGLFPLLVKGQGLAQCYERPLWRYCSDIDFFFSKDTFNRAVDFFLKKNNSVEVQNARYTKSFGVVLDSWFVELHGTLRNGLSTKMDRVIDSIQEDIFKNKNFRIWRNNETDIALPSIDNDLFLVFIHFVRHFYKEGYFLRQICDWCRFIWTYREYVDVILLEERLCKAGVLKEWKAFAAFSVDYLDMKKAFIPLYSEKKRWHKKGKKLLKVLFLRNNSNKIRKLYAIAKIFPWNTLFFTPSIFFNLNWLKFKERIFQSNCEE